VIRVEDTKEVTLTEWERYVSIIKDNPTARPITLESWKRCKELGLEPDNIKFEFLSDEELTQNVLANSQLLEASKPYLDSISMGLIGIPHVVALSDSEGWVIDIRGTTEELGGRTAGICLGANWAERNIGNNGIGTALAMNEPVLIYGIEHFGMVYGACACIGVPITYNRKIIGALDISVLVQHAHPSRLLLAIACVHSIESAISQINKGSQDVLHNNKLSITSELIASAVHDLKNPLAVIRGLGQMGQLTSDNSRTQNYFARIINQADEMDEMAVELLNIFRPEELIPHKVVSILEEVLNTFNPICNSKNIKLALDYNADAYINMCRKLFKRAIENLINNALQVMDKGGSIEVRTELNNDSILISIEDTAGGIPEDIKETIFEPFTFKRSGGTGLGLFTVYHTIINTHKGQIWFETKPGQGTTFYINLPIAQETSVHN